MSISSYFNQLGSPETFYLRCKRLIRFLYPVVAVCLLVWFVWVFFLLQPDLRQQHTVRIMYMHVPAAVLAQLWYLSMTCCSIAYFVWKVKVMAWLAQSIAVVGCLLVAQAFITGALWGKPIWGVWFLWDARIITTLILGLLFLSLLLLRSSIKDFYTRERLVAVLSVVGTLNIPLIKYSVQWWNTLHQQSSISLTKAPAMPAEYYIPLFFAFVTFGLLSLLAILLLTNFKLAQASVSKRWFQKLSAST